MSVTPDFIGQIYKDTNTGNLWRANSLTPGDWTLELQNAQIVWEPNSLKLGEMVGFFTYGDLPGITKIQFLGTTAIAGFDIESMEDLTEIHFPNLISIDPLNTQGGYLYCSHHTSLTLIDLPSLLSIAADCDFRQNTALVTINMPAVTTIGSGFSSYSCPLLTTVNLQSLVTLGGGFSMYSNPSLTTVNLQSWVPTNGKTYRFDACALTAASVNQILARAVANPGYVSGLIRLDAGTNAAPTGQGIIDKATLNARLPGLAVTN